MKEHFTKCAGWMREFLQKQAVLRSTVLQDRELCQVNLYSLDANEKLLCFAYSSHNYPVPDAFATIPIPGPDLVSQLNNLFTDWQRLGLGFWESDLQAEACELTRISISPINPYSLDMMFSYHRLLACLETHPEMPGIYISDVITAHKRLKGFLDEQAREINKVLLSLNRLANK